MLLNVDCIAEEFQKRFHNIICELDDYDLDIRFISTTTKNLSNLLVSDDSTRSLHYPKREQY